MGFTLTLAWKRLTSQRMSPSKAISSLQTSHRDLLSSEALEQKAHTLAEEHRIVRHAGSIKQLKTKLDIHEHALLEAYQVSAEDVSKKRAISPGAEWLLDNMPVVLDQFREIREDLPSGFYKKLPKLSNEPFVGFPRVYSIAIALVYHTDGRLDLEHTLNFVSAYQTVKPLLMGELWAIAIMLRLVLIENLGHLSTLLLEERKLRQEADRLVDRLLERIVQKNSTKSILAELTVQYPVLPTPFAAQFLWRLRDYDNDKSIEAEVEWLENHLTVHYSSIEALIRSEKLRQAANQTTIGNIITSMRTISSINWADWFEKMCYVEQILCKDPARTYGVDTFATRDRYRHIVEHLARGTDLTEIEVAWRLVNVVSQNLDNTETKGVAKSHVGYYLTGLGSKSFQKSINYHAGLGQRIREFILKHPEQFYFGTISGGTLTLLALGLKLGGSKLFHRRLPLTATLLLLPTSEIAQGLANWSISKVFPPRVLPRIDLSEGIPATMRTMIVVPTLLLTKESIGGQFDRLEICYLANADPNLHFALLTDFADAPHAEMPEDKVLIDLATNRIEDLNFRYGSNRFFLFHRGREWNNSQRCFMGWERKRGKLEEFNRLLAGSTETGFQIQVGNLSLLPQIRYVITLDADTRLPRDQAKVLIGAIAHPLNQAVIDKATGQVVKGYGILQPRIGIDLSSANRSHFARIFSGNVGLDPYTTAVSNGYMDLFGVGIYAGKGIYDPKVLQNVLMGRFPENTLLSHDLIEGSYAGTGLLSDVELLDNYPSSYPAYAARMHRWIRGDWQILRWILPNVPQADGKIVPNVLPLMARYRIFDNLRRSLLPSSLVALLVASWLGIIPGKATRWAAISVSPLALPLLFDLLDLLLSVATSRTPIIVLQASSQTLRLDLARFLINLTFLADDAGNNLNAIGRTLVRSFITHRNLLEWETAEQVHHRKDNSHGNLRNRVLFALLPLTLFIRRFWKLSGFPALPMLLDWLAAPVLADWLARSVTVPALQASEADNLELRKLARSYWEYFHTFTTKEGNYLAPDNFQEDPSPVVAYRTSPTNIGLQLLADMAAHDLGYIGLYALTERSERTFATLNALAHYRGHLLNWYDTRTLQPLTPAYVSTVDSGNLAGYLITLRQSYLNKLNQPIIEPQVRAALLDTISLLQEEMLPNDPTTEIEALVWFITNTPLLTLEDYALFFQSVARRIAALTPTTAKAKKWLEHLDEQVISFLTDLENLAPWSFEQLQHPALATLYAYIPVFGALTGLIDTALEALSGGSAAEDELVEMLLKTRNNTLKLIMRHEKLEGEAFEQMHAMDFQFLYDSNRNLFSIGYSLNDGRMDNSYYDLLASESRLASFVAIAKGDVPQEHWFHLSRALTPAGIEAGLISWSGTMFEYLLPLLIMQNYPDTLLDQAYKTVVSQQRQYGRQHKLAWGISESAYNLRDVNMNYQYRAFGVPGLGLKRWLGNELVLAPYATLLALPLQPHAAVENIRALIAEGLQGEYGLYEAVDYTPERLLTGEKKVIIRSYMVHHQAMSLLALDNYLNKNLMQTRFHREPMIRATEMLLQEQFSRQAPRPTSPQIVQESYENYVPKGLATRQYKTPNTPVPYTHLLSNGKYTLVITNSGGGFSRYNGLAVSRWHEDTTQDSWGNFCYIQEVRSGETWSATYQPTCHETQEYEVIYSLHKAEFRQQIVGIETRMEVTVSPEDNAEVRHLFLTNRTEFARELKLTSYCELVLAPSGADNAHPAFSNLFVQTEFLPEQNAILASRRPRSRDEEQVWAIHVVAVRGHITGEVEYETDRAAFIGRNGTLIEPIALKQPLTNTIGAVLDPIFSLRRCVRIVSGGTAHVTFTTAVAQSRKEAVELADKYHDHNVVMRTFELALGDAQVEMQHLNINPDDIHRFQRLASLAIYTDSWLRAAPAILERNTGNQPVLWKYGISGDFPLILVQIGNPEELPLVWELILAHEYWRINDLQIDLVILNQEGEGYNQPLEDQIMALIRNSPAVGWLAKPGGIFVLGKKNMPEEDHILFQTIARAVLLGTWGDLTQQLRFKKSKDRQVLLQLPKAIARTQIYTESPKLEELGLEYGNEYGGFTVGGQEYVINLKPGKPTPAPWSNVLANQSFGCLVTERGSGYTWSQNSRENRLTPWSNDPVCDKPGELIYLRDEDHQLVWTPTSAINGVGHYRTRHGFGYSSFEHIENEIHSELTIFVPPNDSVKIYRLRLRNISVVKRRLSATFYAEWVLGVLREETSLYLITSRDEKTGAVLARNPYNTEFGGLVAFVAGDKQNLNYTCDRREFIGRNGNLGKPAGMSLPSFSESSGAGLDPCVAMRSYLELEGGEEAELIFLLGQAESASQVQEMVTRFRDPNDVERAYAATRQNWQKILQKVQVLTPEPQLDILLNGWMLYQTLSCRIWARSAFYQSGGAYGFRDQLQDVMALTLAAPEITREQLLRAAERQFVEGDVQHWWHPPSGRGVRTRFSDDYLWLPFVTAHYVKTTGNVEALDEILPFLEGRPLAQSEAEYYGYPVTSEAQGTLYNHCIKAIEYALGHLGSHGLPLMGSGDWNDGMNLVGEEGRGESVWLGWFLYLNLLEIAALAENRGENERATGYRLAARNLQTALEKHTWDGEWYLRAFYDDGTPLGSAQNEECRIDSLSQSWAVISGAADPSRSRKAMEAVEQQLIDREAGLIKLFTPPFDKTSHNPGYIKGYVPGVRENGGQYSHAAIWVIWAYAQLGEGQKAMELLHMINPITHSLLNPVLYKVEPYVIAADIYSIAPHTGRGGWTWYTGSSGWLYRLGIEALLGLRREGRFLAFAPCIPPAWKQYEIKYLYNSTDYHIKVENPTGIAKGQIRVELDGLFLATGKVFLQDDGVKHNIRVIISEG